MGWRKLYVMGAALAMLVASVLTAPLASATLTNTFSGTVSASGTISRTHSFSVQGTGQIQATLDWNDVGANLNLFLVDPTGTTVAQATSKTNKPEVITHNATVTGTWKVRAKAVSGSADYTVTVTHSPGVDPSPAAGATFVSAFGYKGPAGLYAYGVDWDPCANRWLIGNYWNYQVDAYAANGDFIRKVSQWADTGKLGGAKAPYDVEAVGDCTFWDADQENSRIVRFNSNDGSWIETIGLGGGPDSWQNYPEGCGGGRTTIPTHVLADHPSSNRIFVGDPRCRDIYIFSNDGHFIDDFNINLTAFGINTPLPRGLDADAAGRIYYVDHNARRIGVFDIDGNQLWVSQQFPTMKDPRGLAINRSTNKLYVAAAFHNEIYEFDIDAANKRITMSNRWQSAGGTRFNTLRFVGVDDAGRVVTGDTWAYRAWRLSPTDPSPYPADTNAVEIPWTGSASKNLGIPQPPPDGGQNQVNGIGVDWSTKRLYTIDTFENRTQAFNLFNGTTPWWCNSKTNCPAFGFAWGTRESGGESMEGFSNPRGLTVGDGRVLAEGSNSVQIFGLNGTFQGRFGSKGIGPGQIKSGPKDIEVVGADGDPGTNDGKIVTVDSGNCRILVWSWSGSVSDSMGGPCGTGTNQMNGPRSMDTWWAKDLIYVADSGRNRIAVWDTASNAIVATVTASFGGTRISGPRGVAIDPTHTWLYIGDTNNDRIVRIRVGTDGKTFTDPQVVTRGQDTPEGRFGGPEYLTFDPSGRLYVSDNNQRTYVFEING
jgi:6-phosphogluconolactonase (cycloisomerase 2 family)